ncbi:NlpC/P60-like cell-wall peptidase [Purpureocillium lilacinum]|uniref:NlpC/P60-like cell-wall peptidase n=1 Tax=Purpureocillium lilacinum TaxID=33203 RepID=A0A179GU15_PURLI|nr:NlpC/P60-like cell-wall peptidase [Purpureocillium lilacinum]KAK4084085.1 hypothetical protein Purlil1_10429 [Purpureocillium lilacinum]OAQ75635.1 NlpC/P60-like cell-wall peptidase [Purpureocillium lilacinum]OAQ81262.1 NlpC/P60-like cell-wall peptidase [Purpureocillium lilacinum]PWI66583.1 hypothetical protein PCL_04996 [Purpureocillium lilacinum]GJN69950.1 hypothetical protein PLICBS_004002 [Purpureocillium lilacinum]
MQLKSFAISLAAVLPLVSAYPITGNDVNCRAGPGTDSKVVKTYAKGTDVKVTCQANGESISGSTIWDKTSDNCYVSDFYVKTGSSGMVVGECSGGSKPPSGGSSYNGKISRKEILQRANYWVSRHIPYSMSKTYPDPQGRRYRTDCSGFVSMALHANSPGYSTVSLPEIAKPISWSDIKPGDLVGTLGPGTGGAAGHVTLFKSFTDKTKKKYNTLECRGSAGCVAHVREVGWKDGKFTSKPYRYIRVTD